MLGLTLPSTEPFLLAVLPRLHRLPVDVLQAQRLPRTLPVGFVREVGEESFFNATCDLGDRGLTDPEGLRDLMLSWACRCRSNARRSSIASTAAAASSSPSFTYRRKACTTSTSTKWGACNPTAGSAIRDATTRPSGVFSSNSTRAEASRTIGREFEPGTDRGPKRG